VINVVKKSNSKIKILRARFSALTEKDIIFSIENLIEPNKNLSDAVELRQKMDLLLGASFTRLQTLYFRKIFEKYIDSNEIKKFSKPSYENKSSSDNLNNKDTNEKKDNKFFKNINYKMIISYGPCQFPTLNFIVERNEEIKKFITKNFYSLVFKLNKKLSDSEIKLLKDNSQYNSSKNQINENDEINQDENDLNKNKILNGYMLIDFHWSKERLDEKSIADKIQKKLQDSYQNKSRSLKVIEEKKKTKIKNPPLPLNTVEMQKLVSRKLKIQSHKTMMIAEKLYNLGYISYPRTETQVYSKSEDLRKIIENLCDNKDNNIDDYKWIEYGKKLLKQHPATIKAREGKLNDNSHPPISPVKYARKSDLSTDEYKIYNLLVTHFLASVSGDAYGEETEIKIEIENEVFTSKGYNLIKKGYLEVYPYEDTNEKFIPHFEKNEIISYDKNSKFEVSEGKTKPPPQMTEAELIDLMDKNGIGTDATIHEHIKTIKER